MKVTLSLENGATMAANVGETEAMDLFRKFTTMICGGGQLYEPKAPAVAPASPVPQIAPKETYDTKLVAFKCDECNSATVIRMSRDTDVGDVITCRCGHEAQIKTMKQAFGSCPNCGEQFRYINVTNGLSELKCRSCRGTIDLVEKRDGSLTNT